MPKRTSSKKPVARKKWPSDKKMREAARQQYEREGEIEIDDNALISRDEPDNSDKGAYVAAWVWVRDEDARVSKVALSENIYKRRMGIK